MPCFLDCRCDSGLSSRARHRHPVVGVRTTAGRESGLNYSLPETCPYCREAPAPASTGSARDECRLLEPSGRGPGIGGPGSAGDGGYEAGTGSLGKSSGRIPFRSRGLTPRRRGDSARRVRWPEQGETEVRPPRLLLFWYRQVSQVTTMWTSAGVALHRRPPTGEPPTTAAEISRDRRTSLSNLGDSRRHPLCSSYDLCQVPTVLAERRLARRGVRQTRAMLIASCIAGRGGGLRQAQDRRRRPPARC
jgi:hypothetical protein